MSKQTIEINVPEGYEVAEGDQPRLPKKGDFFLSEPSEAKECHVDFDYSNYIILKKIAPKYWKGERYDPIFNNKISDVVEIRALSDAVKLYEEAYVNLGDIPKTPIYESLKELLNEN